jgi:glycosyltransferase involved in cell wall biosynthesis
LKQKQAIGNERALRRPRIVIGSLTNDNAGSIPTIALAFISGLGRKYDYHPHYARRSFGFTRTSKFNLLNVYYFFKHFLLWIVALMRHRPHVVHYPVTSGWNLEKSMLFLLVPRLFGIKAVGHLNGGAFDTFWDRMPPWRRSLGAWCIRHLDVFLVTSQGWSEWAQRIVGVQPDRLATVVNPIDGTFEENALSFGPSENTDLFFIGAIGKRKGVYDILEVAAELARRGFPGLIHIAGPEDREGDLEGVRSLIEENQLRNVRLHGPMYGEQKIIYFKEHGIFFFPSYNENFPLVVIEAAAAGRPIITTRVGALPEYFEDEQSLLFVTPGDKNAMVEAVERLCLNADLRIGLATAARKIFKAHLARAIILADLDAVYQRILSQTREESRGAH